MLKDFKSTFGYSFNYGNDTLKTILVSTPESLAPALKTLRTSIASDADVKSIIGLDAFQSGDGACIGGMRLATATTCLLIQRGALSRNDGSLPMRALYRFFQMPDVTFVSVGMSHSLDALGESYGIRCRNFVDLGSLAAASVEDKRLEKCGVADLARQLAVGNRLLGGAMPYAYDMYQSLN